MARRAFLFLVVPVSLAVNAKQKSSAPPPTRDESIPAQRASRFERTNEPAFQNPDRNRQMFHCF